MKKSTIRKGSKIKFSLITAMKPKKTIKWFDGIVNWKKTARGKGWKPAVSVQRGTQTFIKSLTEVKRK